MDIKEIKLSDYKALELNIVSTNLEFDIYEEYTLVSNTMTFKSSSKNPQELFLNGVGLELVSISNDDYQLIDEGIVVSNISQDSTLSIVTKIYPDKNTTLEGLYRSGGIFCTQNEPEGFRHITYFIDRPDNMSLFTTKVIADKEKYPTLLSNGNLIDSGTLDENRHFTIWEDPFAKPSYLFAVVAGDLAVLSDSFITTSGNKVALNIYVDHGNESKCYHAMRSLKASMTWDEETYGREYDLDYYNIVAVDSFNMGAMENKGLNIFNSHYVLANEDTATDNDFLGIESVIAHEYFHNWTGNRITCRDWFQLTLKEGLTVFRDQSFSADMNSPILQRISDVRALKERQFVEDASATAHPIKPTSYMEINNFYTSTIYEKGAEVIRMIHTLIGAENYRKAMDLYFETFDAQAVRTEDFLWAMESVSEMDLSQFKLWYSQEGTPRLNVEVVYDSGNIELSCHQVIPKRVSGKSQEAYYYPLGFAIFTPEGKKIPLDIDNEMLIISEPYETFVFKNIPSSARISINRGFSAPVIIESEHLNYNFLMAHEDDGLARYESAQNYASEVIFELLYEDHTPEGYLYAYESILRDENLELNYKAKLLTIPSLNMLLQEQEIIDVEPLHQARVLLQNYICERHYDLVLEQYKIYHEPTNIALDAESMAKRAYKNMLLNVLMMRDDEEVAELCYAQYTESLTMTDRLSALDALENSSSELKDSALSNFYIRYKDDTLVMNKYFAILAASSREGTIDRVQALENDPCFDIKVPNLVRALIGVFARNHRHFHATTGHGYAYMSQKIIELNSINPQIASGLCGAFKLYDKLNEDNKELMKLELEKIVNHEDISKNVFEIVDKILTR